jgi:Fuc2NAc and GlcNAc transferase
MLIAYWLTGRIYHYALHRELLDIPNARSSHSTPTPRGGGLSIVVVMLLSALAGTELYPDQSGLCYLLALTGFAYAVLGWLDDHFDLSSLVRFVVQILLACGAVGWLMTAGGMALPWHVPTYQLLPVAVLWVVWMANLYNFMDGIDGIAAIEALVLSATSAAWFGAAGADGLMLIALAMAGSSLGFLGWNWSPARIFMGDAGSVALGALFAMIALIGSSRYAIPVAAFIILYAVFLVDTTLTLLKRIVRGEKWWQAHRSHYYQRAVQSGWSHGQVSGAVLIINIVLAGLATALVAGALNEITALTAAGAILAGCLILVDLRSA